MKKLLALGALLVFAGTLEAAALPTGSAPSFAGATHYVTGRTPISVAIGDLNGDGKQDLVTANQRPGTVSVLLNQGNRAFAPKVDYRTGGHPLWSSVAIADLDGDGTLDIATASGDVSVLLNRGDGTFQAARYYAVGSGAGSLAIGDLNGDGKPDIVAGNGVAGTISALLNRGDGTIQARRHSEAGGVAVSLAIGDLNGDGKSDLAIVHDGDRDTVSVLLSRGDGTFRAARQYAVGERAESVAIGDLNGDGKRDLVVANTDESTVSVLLGKGGGRFRAKHDYPTAEPVSVGDGPVAVAIGDLNADRTLDLVTTNFVKTVSLLLGRGDGTFRAALNYRIGCSPSSVAVGDLDGDATPDVATQSTCGHTVSVLFATPGLCNVQAAWGKTLAQAKTALAGGHCRVGAIRRAYSRWYRRGLVSSQQPRFGAVLPTGAKVNLVISRGRRHR